MPPTSREVGPSQQQSIEVSLPSVLQCSLQATWGIICLYSHRTSSARAIERERIPVILHLPLQVHHGVPALSIMLPGMHNPMSWHQLSACHAGLWPEGPPRLEGRDTAGNLQYYLLWHAEEACKQGDEAAVADFLAKMLELLDQKGPHLTWINTTSMIHRCAKVVNATIQAGPQLHCMQGCYSCDACHGVSFHSHGHIESVLRSKLSSLRQLM
jgi:hypothetical protein